jgi:transcriptional regulator with XRE-family HTH domain
MTAVLTAAEILNEGGTVAGPRRQAPKCKYVLPRFVTGSPLTSPASVLGTGSHISTSEGVTALQEHILHTGTQSARIVDAAARGYDYASTLRQVQQRSGLTWGEIARALGVSRRAVHHWASGRRMSDGHVRRVEAFASLVNSHSRSTADLTRKALIALRPDGRSALGLFEEASKPRRSTPLSTLSVGDFLEVDATQAPPPVERPARASIVSPRSVPPRRGATAGD